ncbi:MAG: AAA family ATPase [Bacteroidales bacterium]|jgi:dephospho-CoA kinase|nr:AAA family ATPase [Bacteroidales bacterium]
MYIGITGTLGAGKGAVVEILREYGYKHFSVRDFIAEKIAERGLELNRDTLTFTANNLRETFGSSYITNQLYLKAKASGTKNAVIESIRVVSEIESLKKNSNFILWAVDADVKTRYERIKERKSATDNIDFDTFIANEQREMTTSDPNHQNLSECIKRANHIFFNNGSIEELQKQVLTELRPLH